MINKLLNQYREQILNIVDICTDEDISYFKSQNIIYHILDNVITNDETLYMVITDEKFNDAEALINAVIPSLQPAMNKLHHRGEINEAVIGKYVSIIQALFKVPSLSSVVKSSFNSTDDLLARYGYRKADDNYDDFLDNPVATLKERIDTEIKPLCKTVNLDVNSDEDEDSAYINNLVDNLATIISSCESSITKKDDKIKDLSENLELTNKEFAKAKQDNLDNIEKLEEYKNKIAEIKSKYREESNEELDKALDDIAKLKRIIKTKDNEIELLQSEIQQETMTANDIRDVANYLYNLDSNSIKSILLQFLDNRNISEKVKTPFILEVFTYIANMNGGR